MAQVDSVATFLVEAGAPGVEVRELPTGAEVVAHFAGEPPVAALRRWLADLGWSTDGIAVRRIGDEAWAETWKQHCRAQRIGRQLYVCASWDVPRAPAGRTTITIDPGMAFGTGDHPTTRNCLRLTERAFGARSRPRVLDCGTGSGILAIAAAKLGAEEVWAIDTDPVACEVATANGIQNGVSDRLHVVADMAALSGPFDLVLANLYADLLEELAAPLATRLPPGGWLVCAGFLLADADRIAHVFTTVGLELGSRIDEDGWVTIQLHHAQEPCLSRCS